MKHLIIFCFLFYSITTLSSADKKLNIIIDPGHGGSDSGAIHNQIKESDLVLQISKKILDQFQLNHPDVNVQLTRSENKFISLDDRLKKISDPNSIDLFVSLHANSSSSSYVQGMEIYYQPDQKKKAETIIETITQDLESIGKSKNSLIFAKNLQEVWKLSNSIIRRSSFFVVEKTEFPSVLIELGFLSNPKEAEKLKSATYQSAIAETIVKSIIEYKNTNQ